MGVGSPGFQRYDQTITRSFSRSFLTCGRGKASGYPVLFSSGGMGWSFSSMISDLNGGLSAPPRSSRRSLFGLKDADCALAPAIHMTTASSSRPRAGLVCPLVHVTSHTVTRSLSMTGCAYTAALMSAAAINLITICDDLFIIFLVLRNNHRTREPLYCCPGRRLRHGPVQRLIRQQLDHPARLGRDIAHRLQESVHAVRH